MKALLIVDVQNDFLPGGALPVPGGDQIIPFINKIEKEFKLIIASKDWHPRGHSSFKKWPEHCVQGTRGSDFPEALTIDEILYTVYKGTDPDVESYSPFFDERGGKSALDDFLKQHGVDHLYIVGLATEYCVRASVIDSLALGYKVTVLLSGCRGIHDEDVKSALEEMEARGALLVNGL